MRQRSKRIRSIPGGAADPSFSDNGDNSAKDTTATFFQAGEYDLECQISDGVLSVTSPVTVTVNQTLTSIQITPGSATVPDSGTYQLSAVALDQFGNALTTQPSFTWSTGGYGSVSSDVYTAPSTGTGTHTITASATVDSVTVDGTTSIALGSATAASDVPVIDDGSVQAYPQDGTDVQVVWNDTSGPAPDGFLIEAEADGSSTFEPIGTAGASDTMFMATNLTANQAYTFAVIPFNSAGQGAAVTGVDGNTGLPAVIGSASAAGWYKVSFNDPSDPTATTEQFQHGGTAFTDSGTLTLAESGWIQADSEAQAVQKALTGSLTSYDFNYDVTNTFNYGQSGAFQFNPDLNLGSDVGPAVVVEDEFNETHHGDHNYTDMYVPVTVASGDIDLQATTDPNEISGFLPPAGSSIVGTFVSLDQNAVSSDFAATITWPDHTTATGNIVNTGGGNFYVSVAPASGESLGAYTLSVTRPGTDVVREQGIGIQSPISHLPPIKVVPDAYRPPPAASVSVSSEGTAVTINFTGSGNASDTYYLYRSTSSTYLYSHINVRTLVTRNAAPLVPSPASRKYPYTYLKFEDDSTTSTREDASPLKPAGTYYYAIVVIAHDKRTAVSTIFSATLPPPPPAPTNVTVSLAGGSYSGLDYGNIVVDDPSLPPDPAHGTMPQRQVVSWQWAGPVPAGQQVSFTLLRYYTDGGAVETVFSDRLGSDPSLHRSGTTYTYTDPVALADTPDPGIYQYAVTATVANVASMPTEKAFAPQVYYVEGRNEGTYPTYDPTNPDTTGEELQTYYGSDHFALPSGAPKIAAELHFFVYEFNPASNVPVLDGAFTRQGGGPIILMGFSNGGWACKLVSDTGVTIDYVALFDPVPDSTVTPVPGTIIMGPNVLDGHDWWNYNSTTDNYDTRAMSSSSTNHASLGDANHNTFGGTYHGSEILQQGTVDTIDAEIASFQGKWLA